MQCIWTERNQCFSGPYVSNQVHCCEAEGGGGPLIGLSARTPSLTTPHTLPGPGHNAAIKRVRQSARTNTLPNLMETLSLRICITL